MLILVPRSSILDPRQLNPSLSKPWFSSKPFRQKSPSSIYALVRPLVVRKLYWSGVLLRRTMTMFRGRGTKRYPSNQALYFLSRRRTTTLLTIAFYIAKFLDPSSVYVLVQSCHPAGRRPGSGSGSGSADRTLSAIFLIFRPAGLV